MVKRTSYMLCRVAVIAALAFTFATTSIHTVHAADYNCGAYSAGAYSAGSVCGAATGTDDGLVNTGQALAIGIPAVMILAGTILLFRLRKKSHRSDPGQ